MKNSLTFTRRLGAGFAALGLAVSAAVMWTGPAAASPIMEDPPKDRIAIDVVTVNGSGCPKGTEEVAVAPDNTAFTVTYSAYLAQVGPEAKPADMRKNCQINVFVHVPQGFTYAIAQADYRGYAFLSKGATALLRARYYFQGHSETEFRTHRLNDSPYDDNWQATDRTELPALVFKPCGEQRLFNVNTELRVNKGTSDTRKHTSFIAMDSTDGSIVTKYHFHWKKCPRG